MADKSRELLGTDAELRREVEILQSAEREMAKRMSAQQRLVQTLTEKLEQQVIDFSEIALNFNCILEMN